MTSRGWSVFSAAQSRKLDLKPCGKAAGAVSSDFRASSECHQGVNRRPKGRSAPPGRHADGNGLYLFVQLTGTGSWIQRLVIRRRRRELGPGAVSLAEARELALANRKLVRSGGDPLVERRRVRGMSAFADATRRVVEQR